MTIISWVWYWSIEQETISLCDLWGKNNWGDAPYLDPGFLSGATFQKMGHWSLLIFTELRGLRLEFESTQMNGIWGTGYCTREGLSISLHGGSMKGDMNWISSEWYCEKPTTMAMSWKLNGGGTRGCPNKRQWISSSADWRDPTGSLQTLAWNVRKAHILEPRTKPI